MLNMFTKHLTNKYVAVSFTLPAMLVMHPLLFPSVSLKYLQLDVPFKHFHESNK